MNGGFCVRCGRMHELPAEAARRACRDLMAQLEARGRIDFASPDADPALSTVPLFAPGGGKMLGVLLGRDAQGVERQIFAFSGMFGGRWLAPDWAPPLFDPADLHHVHDPAERAIKVLGAKMAALPPGPERDRLRRERRALSRENTAAIHALYVLQNFRGESRPLTDFYPNAAPPTGSGDCCAPKLVMHALHLGLRPTGMAEFFWGDGGTNGKAHGSFYAPCAEKCGPILGFLLCGL